MRIHIEQFHPGKSYNCPYLKGVILVLSIICTFDINIIRMKNIILFCFTFYLSGITLAQDADEVRIYNNGLDIVPTLSLNNDFNLQDWYTGISGGIEDLSYQWGARLGFNFRPFRKRIQVLEDNNIIRQYHERKYFLSLDLDKRLGHIAIKNQHLQFYVGVKSGLLMGNYAGTRNDADAHFVAAPVAGACLNVGDTFFLKLGFNYFQDRLFNVDDGRINFSLIFILNQ
ncbi:MAG: hypothetical protein ACI8Q1_003619 [Parvicella sp.]